MATKSPIEWTEHTWNPIVGCSIVSPGCTNCYAMKMAARAEAMGISRYDGTTKKVNGNALWTGKLARAPEETLRAPLKRNKPTTYFVNSMGDLFHEDVPVEWIDRVFAVMGLAAGHTFQVLTKRADRMRWYMTEHFANKSSICDAAQEINGGRTMWSGTLAMQMHEAGFFRNVWLGVSTERQQEVDERIPLLLQTPAAVRFVSAEPLLGPISFRWAKWDDWAGPNGLRRETVDHLDGARMIDWLIVGGESGPGARPMHPDWARSLRDECAEAGVAFFFKQWGAWKNGSDFADDAMCVTTDGRVIKPVPDAMYAADRDAPLMRLHPTLMRRVGKKAAGRILDGKLHDAMPLRSSA